MRLQATNRRRGGAGGAFTHAPWQLWQQGRIFERLRESIRNIIKIPYVSQLFSQ